MRKLNNIGWILMMILFSLSAFTQEQETFRFSKNSLLGVRLGGTITSVSLRPAVSNLSSNFSYSGGLSYVYGNKKNVGIQIELLYTSRKWIETFDNTFDVSTELSYIQLPLMTNISLGNGRLKYLINLGTYLAYNINKTQKSELTADHEYYESLMDRAERSGDFGLIIGVGFRYFSNAGTFQLDARFEYGYQNLYNEDRSGFRYSNMSVIQLGLYYFVDLKKIKK